MISKCYVFLLRYIRPTASIRRTMDVENWSETVLMLFYPCSLKYFYFHCPFFLFLLFWHLSPPSHYNDYYFCGFWINSIQFTGWLWAYSLKLYFTTQSHECSWLISWRNICNIIQNSMHCNRIAEKSDSKTWIYFPKTKRKRRHSTAQHKTGKSLMLPVGDVCNKWKIAMSTLYRMR